VNIITDEVANYEETLEKELAEYLSLKTRLDIKIIDMRYVDLIRENGENYFIISGIMINDLKIGHKECSITLKLEDEQAEMLDDAMGRGAVHKGTNGYNFSVGKEDTVSYRYSKGFLTALKRAIDCTKTVVVSLYDKDEKEMLYDSNALTNVR